MVFPYRRVLVTGGAGFIGSHLVEALVARGCKTVVLDDLSSGSAASLPPAVPLIQEDVAEPRVAQLVADSRPDLIIHRCASTDRADVPGAYRLCGYPRAVEERGNHPYGADCTVSTKPSRMGSPLSPLTPPHSRSELPVHTTLLSSRPACCSSGRLCHSSVAGT
ncbi:MAG: NAD-dependent epimerase/dehydratase family protein [Chloroflexi bacterium]|nr:NAD-dependent epimerase/dehydratase family protein [Chloroflexota bacterium]